MTSPRMLAIEIPGEAVPFARAGSNGKRRFTPPKQAKAMQDIKLFAIRAMAGQGPLEGPLEMNVRATYLVPASWSQKKKDAAVWKSSAPDADNLAKLTKDSLNKIAYQDDAQIASLTVQKRYGPIAPLVITIAELA